MNRATMRVTMCVVLSIVLFSTGVSAKVKLKKLLITTQVNSWVEQKEITQKFQPQGLFEIINGGAVEYIDQGMLEGIHQQFTNKGGKTVEVFVEDFGVPEKSRAMVDIKKQGFSEVAPLVAASGVQCFVSKAIGASVVVASLENFYVELTVSGFQDDREAENAAVAFLDYYRQQIR